MKVGVEMAGQRIPDQKRERLAELRAEAKARRERLIAEGPSDPLEALAWKVGTLLEDFPFDNELRELIEAARADGRSWREISIALGQGDDDAAVGRVTSKQHWRNEVYAKHLQSDR